MPLTEEIMHTQFHDKVDEHSALIIQGILTNKRNPKKQ